MFIAGYHIFLSNVDTFWPGFNVEIHRDLTSAGMNSVKRKLTLPSLHADASTFLLLVIRFVDCQTKVFTTIVWPGYVWKKYHKNVLTDSLVQSVFVTKVGREKISQNVQPWHSRQLSPRQGRHQDLEH